MNRIFAFCLVISLFSINLTLLAISMQLGRIADQLRYLVLGAP